MVKLKGTERVLFAVVEQKLRNLESYKKANVVCS